MGYTLKEIHKHFTDNNLMTMSLGQFYYWAKRNNPSSLKSKSTPKTTDQEQSAHSAPNPNLPVENGPSLSSDIAVSKTDGTGKFAKKTGWGRDQLDKLREKAEAQKLQEKPAGEK